MFDLDVPEAPPLVAEDLGADVTEEIGLGSRRLVPDRFVHKNGPVLRPAGGIRGHGIFFGADGLRTRHDFNGGLGGGPGGDGRPRDRERRRQQNEGGRTRDQKTQDAGHDSPPIRPFRQLTQEEGGMSNRGTGGRHAPEPTQDHG